MALKRALDLAVTDIEFRARDMCTPLAPLTLLTNPVSAPDGIILHTHQHIHHEDGHDDEEDGEEGLGEVAVEVGVHEEGVLAVLRERVGRAQVVLAEEDVGVVELADHHDEGLGQRVAQGVEGVLDRERGEWMIRWG